MATQRAQVAWSTLTEPGASFGIVATIGGWSSVVSISTTCDRKEVWFGPLFIPTPVMKTTSLVLGHGAAIIRTMMVSMDGTQPDEI